MVRGASARFSCVQAHGEGFCCALQSWKLPQTMMASIFRQTVSKVVCYLIRSASVCYTVEYCWVPGHGTVAQLSASWWRVLRAAHPNSSSTPRSRLHLLLRQTHCQVSHNWCTINCLPWNCLPVGNSCCLLEYLNTEVKTAPPPTQNPLSSQNYAL